MHITGVGSDLKFNCSSYGFVNAAQSATPLPKVPDSTSQTPVNLNFLPHYKLISFGAKTAEKINRAFKLSELSSAPITQRYDGGYLIDDITNTFLYYGDDARRFLKNAGYFPVETQIIAQDDTELSLKTLNGEEFTLNKPGAILINPKTYANIDVIKGNPLVMTTEKQPYWYTKMTADAFNECREYFEKMVKKNNDNFPHKLPLTDLRNPGNVTSEDFEGCPDWVYEKLCNSGILDQDPEQPSKATWSEFRTIGNLQEDLRDKAEIHGDVKDKILDVWCKTTKSGFDFSGLAFAADGVTVYEHSDRFNPFNLKPTEWMSCSTAWTPEGCLTSGVSRVVHKGSGGVIDFNQVREEEQLHQHQSPELPHQKLAEAYILTGGKMALCTSDGDKENINIYKPGDLIVVPPGLIHGIAAAGGDYEHLCCQAPSTFQYGFRFKNISKPFSTEIKKEAIARL